MVDDMERALLLVTPEKPGLSRWKYLSVPLESTVIPPQMLDKEDRTNIDRCSWFFSAFNAVLCSSLDWLALEKRSSSNYLQLKSLSCGCCDEMSEMEQQLAICASQGRENAWVAAEGFRRYLRANRMAGDPGESSKHCTDWTILGLEWTSFR